MSVAINPFITLYCYIRICSDQVQILNKRQLLLKSATPVLDDECQRLIADLRLKDYVFDFQANLDFPTYYSEFLSWIQASQIVQFQVPPEFTPLMTNGTTQSFDDFYLRHSERTLFIFRGEYPYHYDVFTAHNKKFEYLDTTPLHKNACVILSVPFSATGGTHPRTIEILKTCDKLNIPVLIDMAFLGLGQETQLASLLQHPSIETFTYSFSKMFSLGRMRAGLTWTKSKGSSLQILQSWSYTNWLGHFVARACLRQFPFDFMYYKYSPLQKKLCSDLMLSPSPSYLFAWGDESYEEFSRQGTINRVCLAKLLELEHQNQLLLDK
jgi:hypothetical protein